MTFSCDTTTRAELNGATSKAHWATILNTALGATRRIRCKRDANASAADPWATGTEFRNVGSTGALQINAGRVSGLGRIKGSTLSLAADMSTGASVCRIEGNGRWIQLSLGLSPAAQIANGVASGSVVPYDVAVGGNFTSTNGLGVTTSFAISGGRFLPSGTGPAAPALDANAPATYEIWNWQDPAAPALVGSLALNQRIDDMVMTRAELAAEMGDTAVYQSGTSVIYGKHEFGGLLLVASPGNTEVGNVPLYQFLGTMKPYNQWAGYPGMVGFDLATVETFPMPFKAVLKNAAGTVLKTFDMPGGLPINSPSLSERRTATQPIYVPFNCAQTLFWQNTRTRKSNLGPHIWNGLTGASLNPAMAKSPYVGTGVYPVNFRDNGSVNGMANTHAMPEYPLSANDAITQTQQDPYLFDVNSLGSWQYSAHTLHGWRYVPGQPNGHDWATAPGGPRQDRCVMPSVLSLYMTYPNGNRVQGNVPWRDLVDNWYMASFNDSHFYYTNVKTLDTMPKDEMISNKWGVFGGYYWNGALFGIDAAHRIPTLPIGNGATATGIEDKNGRLIWNGFSNDGLHNYNMPCMGALFLNSPAHVLAQKFRTNMSWINVLGDGSPSVDTRSGFMTRTMAWRHLAYAASWSVASDHPLSYSKTDIEGRWQIELETLYDEVYKPVFLDNENSIYGAALRNLGVASIKQDNGSQDWIQSFGGGLAFYMSQVLALMKQTGSWDAMKAVSTKCSLALDMYLLCLDKASVDYILDGDGRQDDNGPYTPITAFNPINTHTYVPADIPANWAAWALIWPKTGAEDWIHHPDGSRWEQSINAMSKMQHVFIRKRFFPEIAYPRLDAAVAKYTAYMDVVEADIAAEPVVSQKRFKALNYMHPGLGIPNAPTA